MQEMMADSQKSLGNSLPALNSGEGLRFFLTQTFHYEYTGIVNRLRQRLIAIPPEHHGDQKRVSHQLSVSPHGPTPEWSKDRFGNLLATVAIPTVEQSVTFTVEAVVEREDVPCEAVVIKSSPTEARYLAPTRLTAADERLRNFAQQARNGASNEIEAAELICQAVHRQIPYQKGVTSVATTALEAFELGAGVCQDHAHVMLAMCRAVGISARYISGHLLGEGSTHAWVEVLARDGDARHASAFDPCYGRKPDPSYLSIAEGRDYSDVPPTSGTYVGSVENRLTSVASLRVEPFIR
jgi:transglutaminase-like putative cysteine protease